MIKTASDIGNEVLGKLGYLSPQDILMQHNPGMGMPQTPMPMMQQPGMGFGGGYSPYDQMMMQQQAGGMPGGGPYGGYPPGY